MITQFNNTNTLEEFKNELFTFMKTEMCKAHNAMFENDEDKTAALNEIAHELACLCDYLDPKFDNKEIEYKKSKFETNEIISNIEELFKTWYYKQCFSSIQPCPWAAEERESLINYCKEHIDEFKEFAQDTLEHPDEWCIEVAAMCSELLPDEQPAKDELSWIEKLVEVSKNITNNFTYPEWHLFQSCNLWLNYFKGTNDIDYYEDYVKYKEYLNKHYIGWKPNEEDDPNPTYEEYIKNKEKYKI